MKKPLRLGSILPFITGLIMGEGENVYKQRHTYKVRFNPYWSFRDKDTHDRQLQTFFVHGEPVMAYSKKDAIKRWVHADLHNRRKRRRAS